VGKLSRRALARRRIKATIARERARQAVELRERAERRAKTERRQQAQDSAMRRARTTRQRKAYAEWAKTLRGLGEKSAKRARTMEARFRKEAVAIILKEFPGQDTYEKAETLAQKISLLGFARYRAQSKVAKRWTWLKAEKVYVSPSGKIHSERSGKAYLKRATSISRYWHNVRALAEANQKSIASAKKSYDALTPEQRRDLIPSRAEGFYPWERQLEG